MKIKVHDIDWDTDGEEVDLPDEVVVDVESEEDAIDAVSDETGWCINSASLEILEVW